MAQFAPPRVPPLRATVVQQIGAYNASHAQRQIDPAAALAVAAQEGLGGGIGDGGHAFGPFQMNNAGGVLTGRFPGQTPQQLQQWATSPAGIQEALGSIGGVAGGLKGEQAVRAIVSKYERPANIPGEISRALAALGASPVTTSGTSLATAALRHSPGGASPAAPPLPDFRPELAKGLASAAASPTNDLSGFYSTLKQALQARQQHQTVAPGHGVPPVHGPATAPAPSVQAGRLGGFAELLHEGVGGPTHSTGEHIHFAATDPQQELRAIKLAQSLGLSVRENPYTGDTVDPVHAKNSYHYRTFPGTFNGRKLGEAADASGDKAAMLKLYKLLGGR